MKNIIYNFYDILIYDIKKYDNSYYFYYDDEMYLFSIVLDDMNNIKDIYNYVLKNNIDCFTIILNNNNELFSKVKNEYYVLLKVKGIIKYVYSVYDFRYYYLNTDGKNWGKLWSDRLDYYEIQIRELGLKHQTLINSFGLYKGIGENAILYFNMSMNRFNEAKEVSIVHNRIKYPCYLIDYNNPINFVVDYSVRDVAEYIKSYMISDLYKIDTVIDILNSLSLNKIMFNILYSRLLYPSFYFDLFDDIILGSKKDNDVIYYIDIYNRYLNMLKNIYNQFKVKYEMFKIEWLDKIKM